MLAAEPLRAPVRRRAAGARARLQRGAQARNHPGTGAGGGVRETGRHRGRVHRVHVMRVHVSAAGHARRVHVAAH